MKENTDLNEKVSILKFAVSELELEKETTNQDSLELKNQLEDQRTARIKLQKEQDRSNACLTWVNQLYEQLDRDPTGVSDEEKMHALQLLATRSKKAKEECEHLREERQQLQRTISSLKSTSGNSSERNEQLTTGLEEIRKYITDLKTNRGETKRDKPHDKAVSKVKAAVGKILSATNESQRTAALQVVDQVEVQVTSLTEKNKSLETALAQERAKATLLDNTILAQKSDLDRLVPMDKCIQSLVVAWDLDYSQDIGAVSESISERGKILAKATSSQIALEAKVEQLELEKTELEIDSGKQHKEVRRLTAESETLREQLDKLQIFRDEQQKHLKEKAENIDLFRQETELLKKELEEQKKLCVKQTEMLTESSDEEVTLVQRCKEQNDKLSQQAEHSARSIENLRSLLQSKDKATEEAEAKLQEQKKSYDELESAIKGLRQAIASLLGLKEHEIVKFTGPELLTMLGAIKDQVQVGEHTKKELMRFS